MPNDPHSFFETIISAGAILSGFCGTFLAFRIQREASYYSQPALSFDRQEAKDVLIRMTHFTSAFFLLLLGTFSALVFGFLFPLLALAGSAWILARPGLVVGGLVAALVLIGGYSLFLFALF